MRLSPRGRDRAHDHVSPGPNPSSITYVLCRGNIKESSALERTHADLAEQNPIFISL